MGGIVVGEELVVGVLDRVEQVLVVLGEVGVAALGQGQVVVVVQALRERGRGRLLRVGLLHLGEGQLDLGLGPLHLGLPVLPCRLVEATSKME